MRKNGFRDGLIDVILMQNKKWIFKRKNTNVYCTQSLGDKIGGAVFYEYLQFSVYFKLNLIKYTHINYTGDLEDKKCKEN